MGTNDKIRAFLEEETLKHLTGQHDQKKHGNRGGAAFLGEKHQKMLEKSGFERSKKDKDLWRKKVEPIESAAYRGGVRSHVEIYVNNFKQKFYTTNVTGYNKEFSDLKSAISYLVD